MNRDRELPRSNILVRCFPRADRTFQHAVEQLVAEDRALEASDPESAARLERQLRRRYPGARVRVQDALATFGVGPPLWYVYRRDAPASDDSVGEADEAPRPLPSVAPAATPDDDAPAGPGTRPVYSAAAAAAMVGVPLTSVMGWDQDGLVRPLVTREGQNLYSRNDVDDLLYVKRQVMADRTRDEIAAGLAERRSGRRDRADRAGSRRILVLLAERDPYAAEYAEYFLRTEGYDVEVAFDLPEAQLAATSLRPDLAVVELLMAGGNGAELCARLKAGGTAAVLAISSLNDEDLALRSGADAFLAKPLDPLEFVSTVKDLLGESAMLQLQAKR